MIGLPAESAATTPVNGAIVAIDGELLDHVPPEAVFVRIVA
jgi:hypothetical protein